MRVSTDGGRSYPARCERALHPHVPAAPAAVLLFNAAGEASCLAADFDVKRGGPAQVDRDAAAFAELIASCGGRTIADISPNGGRHVYVLWTRPIPIADLRPVVRSLCLLYPSLDPTPMLNPAAGCIRPAGARHRSGGHQVLTTALADARAAVAARCGPQVWGALLDKLAPQMQALDSPEPDAAGPTDDGPQQPPRRVLPPRLARIAERGLYPPDRYKSPSEARQAVITAAAAAGWTLDDVRTALATGRWPGLAGLYARYRAHARAGAITRDWRRAQLYLHGEKSDRKSPTREWTHTGGSRGDHAAQLNGQPVDSGSAGEYQWIRSWWNAVRALERTGRWAGRAGLSTRLVLRALAAMGQMRGTRALDIGRRGLALSCGLDDSTVSAVLRRLRNEDDPVIDLLEADRGERGDLYTLRIPDAALESAAWRTWRPGRFGIHPLFRALGAPAALTFEVLPVDEPLPRREIIRDAALPPHTVDDALRTLAEHGLAERTSTGWRRGLADLDRLAQAFGIPAVLTDLINRYRLERAAWRAFLDGLAHRRHAHAPDSGTLPWPVFLHAPATRGDDDDLYDAELDAIGRGLDIVTAAVDLLQRELGASVLARPG